MSDERNAAEPSGASRGSVANHDAEPAAIARTDARLAALEELSALDQKLELEYGLTGSHMIKAQERTPPPPATPGDGSVRTGCASGRETVR